MRSNKPVIVEQTVNGIRVGYKVGWWYRRGGYRYGYDYNHDQQIFRNIRADSMFRTLDEAQAFRDTIEETRSAVTVKTVTVD